MTVKIHLHQGYDVPELHIKPTNMLGHLYSDNGNIEELHHAAEQVGMKREWFQLEGQTGIAHYDLWGRPLSKALALFDTVTGDAFVSDIEKQHSKGRIRNFPR